MSANWPTTSRESFGAAASAPGSSSKRSTTLPNDPGPAKRRRTTYDFGETFDVIVGESDEGSKTFTLHTKVFTEQSDFLAAARKSEWTAGDSRKPVDLRNEDVGTFQIYLNCVYFGTDTIEQWGDDFSLKFKEGNDGVDAAYRSVFGRLIQLYLLATRLIDYRTANMAIDQLICFEERSRRVPVGGLISSVYESTAQGDPLRLLVCDFWIYRSKGLSERYFRSDKVPREFLQDLAIGLLKTVAQSRDFPQFRWDMHKDDVCYYHFHDEKHPRCVPKSSSGDQKTGAEASRPSRFVRREGMR